MTAGEVMQIIAESAPGRVVTFHANGDSWQISEDDIANARRMLAMFALNLRSEHAVLFWPEMRGWNNRMGRIMLAAEGASHGMN